MSPGRYTGIAPVPLIRFPTKGLLQETAAAIKLIGRGTLAIINCKILFDKIPIHLQIDYCDCHI
jgi:hypothetical protein